METARQRQLDDLCRRFRPALVGYFLRRVRDPAEAEDLAHDVFVRLTGIPLEQLRSADAYVFQVAANLLKDRARRARVRADYADTEKSANEAAGFATPGTDPERIEVARRSLASLVDRLKELPERTREIFILYRIENVSRRDIAQAFQLSLSSVEKEIALLIGILATRYTGPEQFSSGTGQHRNVTLADGSAVNLDASSAVLVRYSGAERSLQLLRDRAKFQVAKDPRRPFTVRAADREVVATGTTFSVEIVQKNVQVILYQGHVSVAGPDRVRTALVAGEELIAQIGLAPVRIETSNIDRSLSWESDRLEFVDEPLASAVERVNRYARAPIAIGDAAAAGERISGVFTAGDTRAFIEGVTAVSALKAEERNGREVLWTSGRTTH